MSEPGELVDAALLRPVRVGNAFEDTVARLLQSVRLGVVAPGEALPAERELAARFAVSRDTVREAIRSLSDAGYLVARRGRYGGTFVADRLPEATTGSETDAAASVSAAEPIDLEDALALRQILEPGAARGAASRALSASERDALYTRSREVAAARPGDYRRLDSRLHLTIGELSGATSVVPLIADNRTRINALLDRIPLLEPNIAHSDAQHEAIVLAILAGDPSRAEEAMREHLDGSAALLRAFLA